MSLRAIAVGGSPYASGSLKTVRRCGPDGSAEAPPFIAGCRGKCSSRGAGASGKRRPLPKGRPHQPALRVGMGPTLGSRAGTCIPPTQESHVIREGAQPADGPKGIAHTAANFPLGAAFPFGGAGGVHHGEEAEAEATEKAPEAQR